MRTILSVVCALCCAPLMAQQTDAGSVAFNLQSEMHHSTRDSRHRNAANTYFTGSWENAAFAFGLRYEHLTMPLPGHEAERGHGLAHLYGKARWKSRAELTVGDFYEQFGSGLALRAYEDRDLGIDNALRGGRLLLTPFDGLSVKLLGGQQRFHFDRNNRIFNRDRGFLLGGDVEFRLPALARASWAEELSRRLVLGASYVLNNDRPTDIVKTFDGRLYRLRQPRTFSTFAGRLTYTGRRVTAVYEHAVKTENPNAVNYYTFGKGQAQMLTLSYAKQGLGALLGIRRSENFDSHTQRSQTDNDLRLNHLLPFTPQQTYTLAALYPYATQAQGEWAVQGELGYTFRKHTPLGGKYGTKLKLAAAYVAGLDSVGTAAHLGTKGPHNRFFAWGRQYYHDVSVEISKKVSPTYSFTVLYAHQAYNQRVIEGHAVNGDLVRSHIFVYDGKYRLSRKSVLRTEAQYLHSRQAEGDWLYGLAEWSLAPHFIFSLSDLWNTGTTDKHYPMASVAFGYKAHRLQLSYGRTREGINCSGGVCRLMPATEGWYLSYNVNF